MPGTYPDSSSSPQKWLGHCLGDEGTEKGSGSSTGKEWGGIGREDSALSPNEATNHRVPEGEASLSLGDTKPILSTLLCGLIANMI